MFGSTLADIISMDTNLIVVRRPNLATDTCTIRVVPHNAISEAAFGPYKVSSVIAKYGGFLQNVELGAIAVDASDNVYVVETASKLVHKTISNIDNIVLGGGTAKTALTPFCGRIGLDGNLYVVENSRSIDRVNVSAGTVARWTQLPSGRVVKFGDFSSGGYFFTGGLKSDLCIVPPNPPVSLPAAQLKLAGAYTTDEILAIRVANGYVYVASRTASTTEPAKIWRNQIVGDSTVGSKELVLDMSSTAYASDPVSDIAFSSAGAMFIGTASPTDPLLIVNPATLKIDNFYKGIVPPYCGAISWSKTSHYLYIISGNTAASQEWTVYRLDMGVTGAR
jgi:hypothetical protein